MQYVISITGSRPLEGFDTLVEWIESPETVGVAVDGEFTHMDFQLVAIAKDFPALNTTIVKLQEMLLAPTAHRCLEHKSKGTSGKIVVGLVNILKPMVTIEWGQIPGQTTND